MRFIGNRLQPVRKFIWIGLPIAHAAEPACIHVKHFETQIGGIADHVARDFFVHDHPAAPTVVYEKRIAWIFPCIRIREDVANPATKNIRRGIGSAGGCAQKNVWSFKTVTGLQPSTKRSRVWIETDLASKRFTIASQCQMGAAAELDAHIPTGLRTVDALNQ